MKCSEGRLGRVLVLRLDDGEILHDCVEKTAGERHIQRAAVLVLGGADRGSRLIVGPEDGRAEVIAPVLTELAGESEIAGIGTLFPDDEGKPSLHMHASCGRGEKSVTGCVRAGVKTWLIQEVIMIELLGLGSKRITDPRSGFKLLEP
jgi:predicted DNA-binding protein with PD1-like motif